MSRVAAFVDAGYFWVQCSQILFNDKRRRGEIVLDVARMREKLLEVIRAEFPYASLLRVYWYDGLGSDGNPTEMHRRIYELDDFKVRYGTRNLEGKQKGIDGLLIADLIGLAQNHGITEALILSGDGDLAPGVAAAQTLGVRVHRLEMGGAEASSPALRAEVDRNVLWPRAEVESFVAPSPFRSESDEEDGQTAFGIGMELEKSGSAGDLLTLSSIPAELDKHLLFSARTALGRKLSQAEKVALRALVKHFLQHGCKGQGATL